MNNIDWLVVLIIVAFCAMIFVWGWILWQIISWVASMFVLALIGVIIIGASEQASDEAKEKDAAVDEAERIVKGEKNE
jgi:purine-cytosine permease-like protein